MTPRFRRDIEGLRAVAVVVVMAYHAGVPRFTGGFVGVDVFFVISGFLITGLLLRDTERSAWARIRHFYARRVRRIVPAATLVILVTLAGAAMLQNPLLQPAARDDAVSAMFFFSNFRFHHLATDYFHQGAAPSLFQHFWSLSVEEQFYIVWPALLVVVSVGAAVRRRGALAVVTAVGVASFVLGWRLTSRDPSFAFFLLPTRAWELCAGAGLALIGDRVRMTTAASRVVRAVGLGLIVAAVFGFDNATPFPGAAGLLPVAGSALVIAAGMPSGDHEGRVLTPGIMQLGGRCSYSLYLWHWPALMLYALRRPSILTNWREAVIVLATVAVPGALVSYHVVERPFRSQFNRRPDRQSLLAGVVIAAVFGLALFPYGAAAATTLDAGQRARVTGVTPDHATPFVPSNMEPTLNGARKFREVVAALDCQRTPLGCVTGDPNATTTVVLYGDSYADHWALAFALLGRRQHWRIEILGRAG
ncbi:MAG TPA: acyltransferase family protein, partial [Acidimicrobiales bacterium]|nr:acyltransferase family protein [Acidimicrobiales bacterium]